MDLDISKLANKINNSWTNNLDLTYFCEWLCKNSSLAATCH